MDRIIAFLLVGLLAGAGALFHRLTRLETLIVMTEPQQPVQATVAVAEWTSSGLTIRVETPRAAGWTKAQWATEHRENVDAMLAQFPRDE